MKREIRLNGISVVPGVGLGKAFFVGRAVQQTSVVSISRQDVGDQIMRFNEIREKAKKEYRDFAQSENVSNAIDSSILYIYEHILDDPAFIGQVVETITTKLYDLETAIRFVSNDFIKRFNAAGTSYFRERSSDMVEICEKLVSYLHMDDGRAKKFMHPVVLVVLRTFTPSDILSHDKSKIMAVISTSGGKTSHAAILARSYSIPVISGVKDITHHIHPGDQLLVNANKGMIHVRPTSTLVSRFEKSKAGLVSRDPLMAKWKRPVYTIDGVKIDVMANVSIAEDVDDASKNGADGIGLVRTEYLIANRKNMPTEKEQQHFYESIFKKSSPKMHCVMRLMDIGGDKIPDFFDMPSEFNPFMGWRGIRIFLDQNNLFQTQLTALMKAGEGQKYSIMLPMVTTLQEWLQAKEFIHSTAQKLGAKVPPLGVLFEVPLAILEMDTFMKEIDFASIGTNDLIQYLSAADRNNSKVNYLYNPIEPAFLKIIKNAIDISNDNGKPVSICGEMAGNPFYTVLLVGLGLRRFSVIPRNIPLIKEIISKVSYAQAAEEISHLSAIETPEGSMKWLKNMNKSLVGDILQQFDITENG